jgi:hypothetical protein
MSRTCCLLLLAVAFAAIALSSGRADPPAPLRDNVPVGRWTIDFGNGVNEACEVHKDGTTSVVEPLRSSAGKAEAKGGSIVLVFEDDRVERWTPVGARMVVEHWAASAQFPSGTPVLGIGELENVKGLKMSIRVDRERYQAGEPVTLEVVIKNAGAEEADLGMSATDLSSFDFVVNYVGGGMTQAGKMPLTKFGSKLLQEVPNSKNVQIRLKAGEQRSYHFALSRMVDLSLSGTYSVSLKRALPDQPRREGEGRNELVSNEVKLEITEPPTPSR